MNRVPITRLATDGAEIDAVARVIRSGWLMQGPEVAGFEKEFASAVRARHAVAVANGTLALELALRVMDVKPGDEVVTVTHSFIATANSIRAVGARPVFVDVEPRTFGMSPDALESAITSRTRAILPVHQIGLPCDIASILRIAARHRIPVIEDAACALGSEVAIDGRWQRIGQPHGAIACFSFHPRKIVTTGDGGMITTDSDTVAARLRSLRNHAIPSFEEVGFNMRMTDVLAAIGRVQLGRLEAILEQRTAIARFFSDAFANRARLEVVKPTDWSRTNWQSYPVLLNSADDATSLLKHLDSHGIDARPGLTNAHEEVAYRDRSTWGCASSPSSPCSTTPCAHLPISTDLRRRTVLLPLFHGMTEEEKRRVVEAVTSFLESPSS